MLDLSTAVTIDSPFVPYNPDSCKIIPRNVSDVYELVPGDHVAVRWHEPVKGERDEDVMWVWCRITAVTEHTKFIAKFDLNHHETMLCPKTKQDTNNTTGFKLRTSKKHLSSWCSFRVLVENEDLPLFKPANVPIANSRVSFLIRTTIINALLLVLKRLNNLRRQLV